MNIPPRFPFLFLAALVCANLVCAQEKSSVAQLAFLAGHWRGTSSSGATAEEIVSAPEGGVMLSTGREFQNGKCTFYDLVAFTEKDGTVLLTPHPNGRRSPHAFALVQFDAAAQRATFENKEHDFPKSFLYEIVSSDRLRITLSGEVKGKPMTETYDLRRVK
jgi:hypothetical protein